MWDPQRLTTLWAFTACYRDTFTLFYIEQYGSAFLLLNETDRYAGGTTSSDTTFIQNMVKIGLQVERGQTQYYDLLSSFTFKKEK
jgi:hypothetical protein